MDSAKFSEYCNKLRAGNLDTGYVLKQALDDEVQETASQILTELLKHITIQDSAYKVLKELCEKYKLEHNFDLYELVYCFSKCENKQCECCDMCIYKYSDDCCSKLKNKVIETLKGV